MGLRKNKKGHFDFITLLIAIIIGLVAYLIAQIHLVKKLYKNNIKNEKNLRVRE
jgi:hypothetical protein